MQTGPALSTLPGLAAPVVPKAARLERRLRGIGRLAVAYSGGVDSTTLLAAARRVLGEGVGAFLAVSPSLAPRERAEARSLARALGAPLYEVATAEHRTPAYRANGPDRCYHCKRHVFAALQEAARGAGFPVLADGTLADDLGDDRPGVRAGRELGVVSPLLEAGFTKPEVRALARALALPVAAKPAQPCLASRIPFHEPVTVAKLAQVARAEAFLRDLGFTTVRVRHHGAVARIEVAPEAVARLLEPELRRRVVAALRGLGFAFVTVDLEGYASGKLWRAGSRGVAEGGHGSGPDQAR